MENRITNKIFESKNEFEHCSQISIQSNLNIVKFEFKFNSNTNEEKEYKLKEVNYIALIS
jgi:hypothetical protein